jgi:hypothetical protein
MKTQYLIIFFILWGVWKVAKPALDKYLQDVQGQLKEQQEKTRPPGEVTPSQTVTTRPATSGETESWELGQPVPGEEGGDDLEHWFQEALERKRQIGSAPATREAPPPPPVPVQEPERAEPFPPPRPARQQRAAYPREAQRQVGSRAERHREVRVEKKRVVVPREPAAQQPKPKRAQHPGQKKVARRRVRQEPAVARLAGIGRLDMHDVRKGIIIAEILGAPKALREIDSHTI